MNNRKIILQVLESPKVKTALLSPTHKHYYELLHRALKGDILANGALFDGLGICPVCGVGMNVEHVMGKEHLENLKKLIEMKTKL